MAVPLVQGVKSAISAYCSESKTPAARPRLNVSCHSCKQVSLVCGGVHAYHLQGNVVHMLDARIIQLLAPDLVLGKLPGARKGSKGKNGASEEHGCITPGNQQLGGAGRGPRRWHHTPLYLALARRPAASPRLFRQVDEESPSQSCRHGRSSQAGTRARQPWLLVGEARCRVGLGQFRLGKSFGHQCGRRRNQGRLAGRDLLRVAAVLKADLRSGRARHLPCD